MTKNLVIVGAGPGLGLSVARRFGRQGFDVALIARRAASLDELVATLGQERITAKGYVGDAADEESLVRTFASIRADMGLVDVLEYSPLTRTVLPASQVTTKDAKAAFQAYFHGAVASVQQVLPDMQRRKTGTILLTVGRAAIVPMWQIGAAGPMAAALRQYALALHEELRRESGSSVHVACGTICCKVTCEIADEIAGVYWRTHTERTKGEELIGADQFVEATLSRPDL